MISTTYSGAYRSIIDGMNSMIGEGKKYRFAADMARDCDVSPMYLKRILSEEKVQYLKNICHVLDTVGFKLAYATDKTQILSLCKRSAEINITKDQGELATQNCLAIPVISLSKATLSTADHQLGQEDIHDWVIISEGMKSMRLRSAAQNPNTLIAIELDRQYDQMEPVLQPGDIIVVDRNDKYERFAPPGNIFIAKEPSAENNESGRICRVLTEPDGQDLRIVYYYDNITKYTPRTWSLKDDFAGEITNALIGRVIWSWSNTVNK